MSNIENLIIPTDEIKMENKNDFKIIVIKPNKLKDLKWDDPNYLDNILSKNIFNIETVNSKNFFEKIAEFLKIKEFENDNKNEIAQVKTLTISEKSECLYELLFLDYNNNDDNNEENENDKENENDEDNELATLLDVNGNRILGNAILLKTYLPLESNNMHFKNMKKEEIKDILFYRVNTKIVIYKDETWKELTWNNDMQNFSDIFFGDDKYKVKKIEIPFLLHNINIWYVVCEYAEENVCGKIINKRIDSCIWYTMRTSNYRGNLTLDEVQKIIKLSDKLEKFEVDVELNKEENDELGRKILKTKYRILDKVYKQHF